MMLSEIWYAAGELESRSVGRPAWTRVGAGRGGPARRVNRPRQAVGRALIGLGRAIAAQPKAAR